jgi:sulfoxide reductase heme-binding subunit YedZ
MSAPLQIDGQPHSRGAPPNSKNTVADAKPRHRSNARTIKPPRWLKPVVIAAGFLPLAWLIYGFTSDLLLNTRHLGSNPIKEMEHYTGDWNLRFLAACLAITPAIRITRQGWLIPYRRIFGLFAFLYIVCHLAIYFVLDVELTWSDLVEDVLKRKYITLGMIGFLLLIPLAITSTKGWIRRLGNKRWNAIHRAVYVSAVLGTIHFWMSVKRDITDPLIFALIFAALLGWRVWRWRKSGRRGELEPRGVSPAAT